MRDVTAVRAEHLAAQAGGPDEHGHCHSARPADAAQVYLPGQGAWPRPKELGAKFCCVQVRLSNAQAADVNYQSYACMCSCIFVQTWNGRGDATEGDFLPAADVVFTIDIDSNTGEEMVTVAESKPARRQGDNSLSAQVPQKPRCRHTQVLASDCISKNVQLISI